MNLWRMSDHSSLDGGGGVIVSARWNTVEHPIVYLAASAKGALLETLVHLEIDGEDLPSGYTLLRVDVPDDLRVVTLADSRWHLSDPLHTSRSLGDRWLKAITSALAIVPSAIMLDTQNYLMNPLHQDATRISIVGSSKAGYDLRLIGNDAT